MPSSRVFIVCCLAVLTLLFAWRCARTYHVFNDTVDEAAHIACGIEMWQTHQYTIEAQHPPLARIVLGAPACWAGLRTASYPSLWQGSSIELYWRSLTWARAGNLVFVPFLLTYVYLWASRLYGRAPGLLAALLTSFCPNVLAHASLATVDFGAAASMFASLYYFYRWCRKPVLWRAAVAAIFFAIAALTKFSALALMPPAVVLFCLLSLREPDSPLRRIGWREATRQGAAFLGLAALVIWAGYLFEFGPLPPARIPPVPRTLGQYLESGILVATRNGSIPAPRFFRGIFEVMAHNAYGHPSYLLGEVRQFGFWYYFPVALAVKTTLPLLLLVALAVAVLVSTRPRGPLRQSLYPLAAAAAILAVCMRSSIDIGIRHILVIYPLFAMLAASVLAAAISSGGARRYILLILTAALTAWHITESAVAAPDYLAYFNEIARGREEQFLLDSNLDWGQDLERLRLYLGSHHIATLHISYFGRTDPKFLGIDARPLRPGARPAGWVAVSKSHLGGIKRERQELDWLKGRPPAAQIGKSILLFHFQRES